MADVFSQHGGVMSQEQIGQYLDMVSLLPEQRNYVKQVLMKFDVPAYSAGITQQEFFKALDDMTQNTGDPIGPAEIERIKARFQ